MTTLYLIYKQLFDEEGNIKRIELVELDSNEKNAISFSKLYNLQTPKDLKDRVQYTYLGVLVSK